jgi:hypothetical protein
MNWLFLPPSLEDLIQLLKAWRFWVLGTLVGAVLGVAIYSLSPPPYRAGATVNVDFNLEEAWPDETDRQQFYYLERETRKLEEIAWSDAVIRVVSERTNLSVIELRGDVLMLSQPAEAGWHFFAEDHDPGRAAFAATTWAEEFVARAGDETASQPGINSYIQFSVTQVAGLPVKRSILPGTYMLSGSIGLLTLTASMFLFLKPAKKS